MRTEQEIIAMLNRFERLQDDLSVIVANNCGDKREDAMSAFNHNAPYVACLQWMLGADTIR